MRYGVQLFGLYQVEGKNSEKLYSQIRKLGYQYVEPCLYLDAETDLLQSVWGKNTAKEQMKQIISHGLKIKSCHLLSENIFDKVKLIEDLSKQYGFDQVVIKCPEMISLKIYEEFAKKCIHLSNQLQKIGIELLLHNDGKEIQTRFGDISAYEWLLHYGKGKIGAQPDVGWLLYGGEDPETFLWRNKEFIKSLHYKDMLQTEEGMKETAVGEGILDIEACFQFARAMEIPQLVDQDCSERGMLTDLQCFKAVFEGMSQLRTHTKSTLCILDTITGRVNKIKEYNTIIEAPNWMKNGKSILYNSEGFLWKYDLSTNTDEKIETGECDNCNNDHVLSFDGSKIAFSHGAKGKMESYIYWIPVEGGKPKKCVKESPSFLHGWSVDGTQLAYCAFRKNNTCSEYSVDIYAMDLDRDEEIQLTKNAGFNDGPEYDPNDKYIWFNSTRTGLMQIWRMNKNGDDQKQMTFHDRNNWFAHVSPDGKTVVYLSYSKEGLDAGEHLPNMNVELWKMNSNGEEHTKLLSFFGGQGSMNVNSWSADNRHLAFVMYELKHK